MATGKDRTFFNFWKSSLIASGVGYFTPSRICAPSSQHKTFIYVGAKAELGNRKREERYK